MARLVALWPNMSLERLSSVQAALDLNEGERKARCMSDTVRL